ncbi:MAG: PKD domain-containing protein [Bacteroidia bacterium]
MKKLFILAGVLLLSITSGLTQTATWSAVAPSYFPTNVSGQIHGISRVSQLKFHPSNPNKLYAVSARGGLFISSNGGTSWSLAPGCDLMPGMRLASVCIDHTNDQIIYLGTGDHNYYYSGSGVYKSTNGGATFTSANSGMGSKLVVDMIMDPANNQVIVAATNSGIYRTTNAGSTWTLVSAAHAFDDLKQKAAGSRTLYAATTDSAFFRSADFGMTWTQITNGIVMPSGVTNGNGCRVAVSPADTNIVYFGMVANGGMLYKSTDGGSTFTSIKTTSPPYLTYYTNNSADVGQGDYNFGLGIDRADANIVYWVGHAVWKSTDGGVNWSQLTNWWATVHTDMHQIITSPYNNGQLWNMNDGGVWLSTNGGTGWTPKSDGIYGYEIYHGSCSPTRKDMISIGTQDNGELYYANTGTGWFCNRGGDWTPRCAFDYFPNSQRVYYYSNARRRNVTGGESTFGLPRTSFRDIAFYRSNPNICFVGDSNVYRTSNLSATTPTWTQVSTINKKIMAVHVNQADSNRLYVITSDQMIYVSTNAFTAAPTFTSYALPNATSNNASIVSVKTNANTLYAVMNTKVYKSVNGGATWTDVSYNLPSVNYVGMVTDDFFPSTELIIVAGGNNSVYFKLGTHPSWSLFHQGLPSRTTIPDISLYDDGTSNAVLRVSTYGRGMWETPISTLRALNASLTASTNTPCTGDSVQFSDLSTGSPTSWLWSFPGGNPSTSTLQNPKVAYSTAGTFSVSLTVSGPGGSNTITKTNYITTLGAGIPVAEDFEGTTFPPDGWSNIDAGSNGYSWARSSQASAFGIGSGSAYFNNYAWNTGGQKDELRTKKFNLSGFSNYWLIFDVAHQMFAAGYVDSLQVLISNNCGNSFSSVYVKGAPQLATVSGYNGSSFVPTSSQWRTDSVNITPYAGQDIQLSIANIGHYGNGIYVDNVRIEGQNPYITLNVKVFIEGFYNPVTNGLNAIADPMHPAESDTISVALASAASPFNIVYTDEGIVGTNGNAQFNFPIAALNQSFYIVVRHRNAVETWSKTPVLFNSTSKSIDLTSY